MNSCLRLDLFRTLLAMFCENANLTQAHRIFSMKAEDYLDRGSSFRRSEGSDGSAVSIPAHRHDPSVHLQGAAPGVAIATTQHGLCLPTEGSAGPAASISAHCHVPSIYPKGATRGAEIGATGRCLSLGRPKGCVGAEDFISATSGFPDESIEGCLAATSSVKIKRHSVFRHSKMLAMMAFLIVLNFLPMGDALLRSTHPTPPSKTDYCNDVTCEEYDENYCDSYDTEDSTSTDTSPNKDAECFCCGSEPTVTCNATAGELKNVVEKYVDDIGVILEEGIIEKKIITAYPHCSSEYLQELLLVRKYYNAPCIVSIEIVFSLMSKICMN